ncbi:MAG: pyridoxamine 5'-phosphate oxidase family protein [Planctomycetota bacterium]
MSDTPRERFQDLITGFSNAMLVTSKADGSLRARPMQIAEVESDADLWFVTELDSAKTDEINDHPEVAVTFQDGKKYLSLTGEARIVADQEKINELWQESWKVWFPEGKESSNITLLHVQAKVGEYWDNSGMKGLTYLFEAGKAYLEGKQPDLGEEIHETVDLYR